jgi:DNA-binding NtrC family response regulator
MSLNSKPRIEPPPAGEVAASTAEVLLLDRDENIREGLRQLLAASGLIVTACGDSSRALELATQKFFAVALVDADTASVDEGVAVLERLRELSPATRAVLLANRQTFDLAVRGFRAGAVDVVAKVPESVKQLVAAAERLCKEGARAAERDRLLRDTLEVHDQFLKRLMDASRKARAAEEQQVRGQSGPMPLEEVRVLVVDENPRTAAGLVEALSASTPPYSCTSATNGGEALDYATQHGFQIAVVNERLPDLPFSMVVKTLRKASDGIVLTFANPTQTPGRVRVVEETQTIELVPELTRGEQLVEAIHKMREAYMVKARERHYLQAFRSEHYDFLKRYVELRQKLTALLPQERAR